MNFSPRTGVLTCLLLLALIFAGCTTTDAPSTDSGPTATPFEPTPRTVVVSGDTGAANGAPPGVVSLYERMDLNVLPAIYSYSSQVFSTFIGTISFVKVTNVGGTDLNFTLADDNGTTFNTALLAPGQTYLNRTGNYVNFGDVALNVTPVFYAGGSLSVQHLRWWFKADETTGNTSTDASGKGHTLNINASTANWITGRVNNGVLLSPATYMNVSSTVNLTNGSFANCFWLNATGLPPANTYVYLFHQGVLGGWVGAGVAGGNATNATSAMLEANGRMTWSLKLNNSPVVNLTYNFSTLVDSTWRHYCFSFNTTGMSIYLNGTSLNSTVPLAFQTVNGSLANWIFGDGVNTSSNTLYNSTFAYDELMFFNNSLTVLQSQYLFNMSRKPNALVSVVVKRG